MKKSTLKNKSKKMDSTDEERNEGEEQEMKTEDSEEGVANGTEVTPKKRSSRASSGKLNDSNEEDESKEDVPQENGRVSKKRKKDEDKSDEEEEKPASDNETEKQGGKKAKKSKKTASKKKEKKEEAADEPEEEYEVEKIVDQRTMKGKRQFKVRWLGYTEAEDTWEYESTLSCPRLIEEFLEDAQDMEEEETKKSGPSKQPKSKAKKKAKKQKPAANKKGKGGSEEQEEEEENGGEEGKSDTEYEVEKIIEVHFKKDGKREFLIRWKGFKAADDTWEPEEHLNCRTLIEKFMEKVENSKQFEAKELRVVPKHTKRLNLTMHADKRQSRRNANKERVSYHED